MEKEEIVEKIAREKDKGNLISGIYRGKKIIYLEREQVKK